MIQVTSDKEDNFINPNKLEPLGIEYIGACVQNSGYDVEIFSDSFDNIQNIVEKIKKDKVNVVGISTFTHSYKKGLEIAKKIKKSNEGVKIVFGGVHASSCPEIIRDDAIDYVVAGEGEKTFIKLLNAMFNDLSLDRINGIVHKSSNNFGLPQRIDIVENLDDFNENPYPLRRNDIIKASKIYGLIYPVPSDQSGVALILYSRGCKYKCDYCSLSLIFGNKVRFRNTDNVAMEIKNLVREYNVNLLYFVDANFNNSKNQVLSLCDKIIKEKLDLNWYALCSINGFDQQILEYMSKAGCKKIGVGIETVNPDKIRKIKNCDMNEVKEVLNVADKLGIIIKGFFMLGFPWEKPEEIEEMPELLAEIAIDELSISFYTPFPGTISYKLFNRRLETDDFDKFTTNEPVIMHDLISRERYIDLRNFIYKNFYKSILYHQRIESKMIRYPYLKESYHIFFNELINEGII
ncbi:MAG: cobalamin B12-binding domain-containing protein [Candidatus Helarchaeota archaeon]|nr:cobalamin B12-binding domain-containing protein [Candidatus Helarchaeota archaeon]